MVTALSPCLVKGTAAHLMVEKVSMIVRKCKMSKNVKISAGSKAVNARVSSTQTRRECVRFMQLSCHIQQTSVVHVATRFY